MVRCAITDFFSTSEDGPSQQRRALKSARRWALHGIELIQLREKHLNAGALLSLTEEVLQVVRPLSGNRTRLLINSRADVAAAARADGVHLTSRPGELTPAQVRRVFARAGLATPLVSISCHTLEDVRRANQNGADYILFGPVFEKRSRGELLVAGSGLEQLRQACELAGPVPVLALGGVTAENSGSCLEAGAAGVAGIRIFATGEATATATATSAPSPQR